MARHPSFDSIQRKLGKRIRAVRLEAELTQEAAAAKAGIDYKRWQRLEAGEVNATIRTLVRVSRGVGVSFWELLGDNQD